MATNQTKSKRLSQGQRKHVRRMKQEARKTGVAYTPSRTVAVKSVASKK